ncbi:amino acid adenylation domain-containing protein, partial [Alcaligenes faecalis]|uniref:amino acid adenylation domain-containing protein n=1 Tax=Alcaligenes faecalis TaxID=511 RepID=UPI002933F2C9
MSKNVLMQLAERFAVLSPAQQKKFYAKVQEQGQSYEQFPIVPLTEHDPEGQPVSYAQQRQWFLWELDRESSAYHLSSALQLQGQLNREALRQSFDYLLLRHTQLRTVFSRAGDGQIKQRVLAVESVAIREQDMRDLLPQDRPERIQTTLRDWQLQPFDLEQGPLLRIGLIRSDENTHILLVVVHHIVADDGSLQLLVEEWAQAYQAFTQGQTPLLEPLPVEYADYAQWQRHWMQAGEQQRQLDYWLERLGGHQPVLQLPSDGARRQDGRYTVASHQVIFTPAQMLALRSVCAQGQMSLFMALLAAFELLLYRYTAQEDIRVGIPVSNRARPETEGLVGFFANTQVMQNRLHERLSLRELLALTRTAVMQAQAHQDLPFEQLVQALHPERALGVNPLFQVMFNHLVQSKGQEGELLLGLSLHDYPLASQQAQFELVFNTHETQDGGLVLACSYAKELFLPSTISRLCEHYQHILAALVEIPDCLIGNLTLVSGEQGCELRQWGQGRAQHGASRPVHEQLSVHAQTRPDAPALVFEGHALSYGQLEAQANRLAHALMARGVRPEDRVGIAVSRSLEMVVGMMAVLKAGAAYVPLDLDYPADRLRHMAQDSGMALLLSHSDVDTSSWRPFEVSLVLLDRLDTSVYPADCPAVTVHEEQLAYLIYTSGSTGLPKGVAVRHRGLSLCMAWMQHAYALGSDDTVLHKAPFSFDVSCWEIFWPLSQGVRLVIASPGDHRDPQRIFELIERYQITTVNFVPLMLQAFLSHCGDRVPSLRHVMCGGEAISSAVQSLSVQRLGAGVLQNLYGPTETTIHVTRWTCVDDGRTPVPIGRPIDQTQAYVLDGALNLVPAGVEGELYIGGDLLARGYENRAELTAERFVADPFSEGGRLYRTGDLVRWNKEGQLEYLGRLDHQVKVRGFRIELGEVESQLLSLDGVREAVVVARPGPQGMQLVGYVSGDVSGLTLRDQLSSQLPDYMVPSVIMVLEALPLNANGKIDRKALPEPEFVSGQAYEAPQGELETTLATIWSQVLGVEQVGRQDNFFELGGHSLLALTLIERLRAAGIVSQ